MVRTMRIGALPPVSVPAGVDLPALPSGYADTTIHGVP